EGCRGEYVPVRLDLYGGRGEHLPEEPLHGLRGEAPVLAPAIAVVATDRADARNRREHHPARSENALDRRHRRWDIEDELQRLGQDHAIEARGRDVIGTREVRNNSCSVTIRHVKDLGARHTAATEPTGIRVVRDLQDS